MDMEHKKPKKLDVLATHVDGVTPKTLDSHYVKDIKHYFDNPEKTPFNYVMGDMLDQREYFRDYRLTQKGKLLWDQMLRWYARQLCVMHDQSCCSRMKDLHLPFSCKFNDNETLASYANGRYDYYGVEQIEEFVAFMGAYEIESMFKAFDDFDDSVCRPENLAILRYCYENYEYTYYINAFIQKASVVQEETNILQESMEEEIDETVSSLDEKDEEEERRTKGGRSDQLPAPTF